MTGPSRLPLAVHLGGVACVLVVSSFVVGHQAYVFLDEAALLAQVEVVQSGSWTVERPFAEIDPAGRLVPMARSTVVGDRFAPFPNHPLHVHLASTAERIGGRTGIALLSVLGVVGASFAAGLLASPAGRAHAAVAVWATAVLSPLVFDANLVVAHGLASGLTGLLFVSVFRWAPAASRRGTAAVAGLAAATAVVGLAGALLRSEVILLCGVLALVASARAVLDRLPSLAVPGWSAGLGGLAAFMLEPAWIDHLVGTSPGQKAIAASSRGGGAGAVEGAWKVLLQAGEPPSGPLIVAVALAVAAVVLVRLRPDDPTLAVLVSLAAVGAAVVHLSDHRIVAGLLWAFPLLAVGLAASAPRSADRAPNCIRYSLVAAVFFGATVLVTQYRVGGGVEWGWRYFAVALPALCAGLSLPLVRLWRSRGDALGRGAVAAVVAVCLLVPLSGVLTQRRVMDRTDQLLSALEKAIERNRATLVLAADSSFGRYAWQRSIAGDVVTVRAGGLAVVSEALPDEPMLLVYVGTPPSLPDGLEFAGDPVVLLPGAFAAIPVRRS